MSEPRAGSSKRCAPNPINDHSHGFRATKGQGFRGLGLGFRGFRATKSQGFGGLGFGASGCLLSFFWFVEMILSVMV